MEKMRRFRVLVMRQISRAGRPGAAGALLLVLCAAFYYFQVQVQQQRIVKLERDLVKLRNRPQHAVPTRKVLTTDEQLAAFYAYFPSHAKTADILATLYAEAGKQSLHIDRAEYRAVDDAIGRITRYQITLPVRGSYLQIRRFVAGLLTDIPIASIENVQFQRQKAGDTSVEAKIRLVLYLGAAA